VIPLQAIRERLKSANGGPFKYVRGAGALAAALDRQQFANGEAFVVVPNKQAGKNDLVNAVNQKTTATVAIMYWVKDAADGTGEAAGDDNEALVDGIQAALLNWSPEPGVFTSFNYGGGKLIQFAPPFALYSEEYTTTFQVRKTS
jgi:hypothetical protein